MAKLSATRGLNKKEQELLECMLTAEFPGSEELQAQIGRVEVCAECDCGCGSIDLQVEGQSGHGVENEQIAVEAYGKGVDVLLFVRDGLLSSLEIVDQGDARPPAYPTPAGLKLWVRPLHRGGGGTSKNDPS
jgi:hypothetical protein